MTEEAKRCVVLAAKLFDYRAAALVLGGMHQTSAELGLVESEGEQ